MSTVKQTPVLEVKNLCKSFDDVQILKNISLSLQKGEVISLLGSSGSGKSTFLSCLNLLEYPDAGEIILNGNLLNLKTSVKGLIAQNERQLQYYRTQVGIVFQNFNLWAHMTILENITEGPVHIIKQPKDLANSGMTMIIVTHEIEFAKNVSDQILFFHQGIIEEQGKTNEIFKQPSSKHFKQFINHVV